MVMVFNATFNNISVISLWSVLLVEETSENHWPVSSHWQTLSLIKIHANMKIVTSELKFPWWCEIKYHGFIIIHVIPFFMNLRVLSNHEIMNSTNICRHVYIYWL